MTALMAAARVPGLALAVIDDGRVVYRHAWGSAGGAPLRVDSVMYGASLSKAMFAVLVLQLADEGRIDLDAPLPRQLARPLPDYPEFADLAADPRWRDITPRMLLSHSAGLLNWRWINPDKKLDIKFAPGSRYVYSGEGMQILQLVVEERSGRPLADLMQEKVFDRFGMANTSMRWRADFAGREANHFGAAGEAITHNRRTRARAAGSADTTLNDAAAFLAAVLRGEAPAAMLRPQLPIVSPRQFPSHWPGQTEANRAIGLSAALGWIVYDAPQGSAFFKEGSDDGTNNLLFGLTRGKRGIVMLSNSSNAKMLFYPALNFLLGNTCLPWYWMGYAPYDRPVAADGAPVVTPACASAEQRRLN